MVTIGDSAPGFELPGFEGEEQETFNLSEATDQGNAILLVFYPFDFSPVCTNELCAIRDAEWFQLTPDLEVWAISTDSVYAHRAFSEEYDLNFPLLSDSHGSVAESFDICYDEWEGHEAVPKRAVVLIDSDQQIRYVWHTDDALEKPDFSPVKEAINEMNVTDENGEASDLDLYVTYEAGPGRLS